MAGRASRWGYVHVQQRARKQGTEDATGTNESHPGKALLERATRGRNRKLERYLETGSHQPRSEAELERLLDGKAAERKDKDEWLRGVLDACED